MKSANTYVLEKPKSGIAVPANGAIPTDLLIGDKWVQGSGDRIEVRQDPDGYQFGVIKPLAGQLSFFRQKREGVDEWIEGEAERIDYDGKADRLTLLGRADFRRYRGTVLSDQATGQRIIYENLTDQFTVDGIVGGVKPANGTGRVRAVLTPKPNNEAGK